MMHVYSIVLLFVEQIGVIALEDDTEVRFDFPAGVSVTFGGVQFDSANPLVITILSYQVFHVEAQADLTGTRVRSTGNQPIAVFAGRR